MTTLEWQKFLAEQKELHRKVIFSVPELANAARTTRHGLNTELGRLVARGIITRYAQGRYGLANAVELEQLLPALDPCAYVTGFHALFCHHLVTQAPSEITCFTNRRHNRLANRSTPAGRLRFLCINQRIYSRPDGIIALREQALCDFVFLSLRDGVNPRHLVTFRNLDALNQTRLRKTLSHYPPEVADTVRQLCHRGAMGPAKALMSS